VATEAVAELCASAVRVQVLDLLWPDARALERGEPRRWSPRQEGRKRGGEPGDERARGGVEEEVVAGGDDDEHHERRVERPDRTDEGRRPWRSRAAATITA
jgi:hypothetical protein